MRPLGQYVLKYCLVLDCILIWYKLSQFIPCDCELRLCTVVCTERRRIMSNTGCGLEYHAESVTVGHGVMDQL